ADDEIAQIESRTQACLSMTEMQAMTRSVNIVQLSRTEQETRTLALQCLVRVIPGIGERIGKQRHLAL
ncbi:MAG: hypothetical protein M0P13_09250, partial [Fibrobacteraceae bacterium]|nr:hypothetical protein [Fibrobacteraceae bacterium]